MALSLSDPFCVDRHRPEFLKLIKDFVDILFANEAEIMSLYETPLFDVAARQAQKDTKLAALTRSEKGSVILSDGKSIAIPAAPVAQVVDTTGAGDLYAAGFLFGVAIGKDLETSGRLGSMAAARDHLPHRRAAGGEAGGAGAQAGAAGVRDGTSRCQAGPWIPVSRPGAHCGDVAVHTECGCLLSLCL